MTVKPDPPPQVEVGPAGLGPAAASRLFQLFAAQTLPAGSMDTSVTIWMLTLWKMWMTSPAFVPGGCPAVLSPANRAAERPHILPTQTSSLPSMFKPHGMLSAGPGEPSGAGVGPSGRVIFTPPGMRARGASIFFTKCAVIGLNCATLD